MSRLEADEEAELVRHAKAEKWVYFKINILGNRGWPDRLFIRFPALAVWIEMKKWGKKPRALQLYRINQLVKLGFKASWFDNAKDAIKFLDAARISATGHQADAESGGGRAISGPGPGKD